MRANHILCITCMLIVGRGLSTGSESTEFSVNKAVEWVQHNSVAPIEYVTHKFEDYDIVILGEEHRVRQFPQFVAQCIPSLYDHGVTAIAMEFDNSINQPLIDSFLALPWLDNELLYTIKRRDAGNTFALFKEYNDIFRACWSFNRCLSDSLPQFRIIALDLSDDDSSVTATGPERVYARDQHMFNILEREVILQGKKALVYCGWVHALTKLTPPKLSGGEISKTEHRVRLGNHIWGCCREQAFSIYMYAPYIFTPDSTITRVDVIVPVDGYIDTVMNILNNQPVGFDIARSPFAMLADDGAYFRFMKEDWQLADVCDGYLFLAPLSRLDVVAIENIFGSDSIYRSLNPDLCRSYSLERYLEMRIEDAQRTLKSLVSRAYDNLWKSR